MDSKYILLEITQQCNLECKYCYTDWPPQPSGKVLPHLTYKHIKKIINNLSSFIGINSITLMGGEPLLHPKLNQIVSFLHTQTKQVGISTKAHLLDKDRIERLVHAGISFFEISLDSLDETIYYTLTGSNDLKKTKDAILLIKQHNIKCAVTIVVTKLNYRQLAVVIDLCFAFGVDRVYLNKFIPIGNGSRNREMLDITDKEFEYTLKKVNSKNSRYRMQIGLGTPIKECLIDLGEYSFLQKSSCNLDNNKIVIDPKGNLKGCELSPDTIGNLLKDDTRELLLDLERIGCPAQYEESCLKCNLLNECRGGCLHLLTLNPDK